MTDIDAVMFARKFTFLKDEEIKKLNSLNNPPKLRIIQRILLETMWFLNFGEILDKEKEQKF
jgi:tyrosyl-tRNA synthetase